MPTQFTFDTLTQFLDLLHPEEDEGRRLNPAMLQALASVSLEGYFGFKYVLPKEMFLAFRQEMIDTAEQLVIDTKKDTFGFTFLEYIFEFQNLESYTIK